MAHPFRHLLPVSLLVVAVAFITGCCCGGGGSSDIDWDDLGSTDSGDVGTFAKSCNDKKSLSTCSEHTDKSMELLGEDFYKSICELTDGTWGTGKCPTENVVGKCDDGSGMLTFYYSDGGAQYSTETAKQACSDMLGTFKE